MHIDLQTAITVLKILPVSLGLRVTGQLVAREVGVVGGEAVIAGERLSQVDRILLELLIVDLCASAGNIPAEIVERYLLFIGEVFPGPPEAFTRLHLLILHKIKEDLNGQYFFHVQFVRFEIPACQSFIDRLELVPALHELHYLFELTESNLGLVHTRRIV